MPSARVDPDSAAPTLAPPSSWAVSLIPACELCSQPFTRSYFVGFALNRLSTGAAKAL